MTDPGAVLGFEPEDLDGHTIDELTDYLERGRAPVDPSIEDSPACRSALRALQRLRDLARTYLDDDQDREEPGRSWIGAVLAAIPIEARAGRRFPFALDDPAVTVHVTEGAIRGLIRAVGDDVPGLLVGSVRLGDDRPASLTIDVALVHGAPLTDAVAVFRRGLQQVLPEQVPFPIGAIDIHVVALIEPDGTPGQR